jgi:DNA (cytosine-5)-methyltransferase 1
VELFAGAGGMALGLENAGLNHLSLNEIDAAAVATLRTNRPDWPVIHEDIRNLNFAPLLGRADIVQAGFPCQAFSQAGKRQGFNDPRGVMFFEFVRAVRELQPRIAIGENVKGLLWHDGGKTLRFMTTVLRACGYRVEHRLLRAQYFDVPQKRERLLIFAVRDDLDVPVIFPEETGYTIPLRDAIGDRPGGPGERYSERKHRILKTVPAGGNWRDLPEVLRHEYVSDRRGAGSQTGLARRLSWDEPAPTLLCSPQSKLTERCHPDETRPLNIREYARVQTFPDSWQFNGSIASQYKQIGNAVPVNLGYHVGRAAIAMLDEAA